MKLGRMILVLKRSDIFKTLLCKTKRNVACLLHILRRVSFAMISSLRPVLA